MFLSRLGHQLRRFSSCLERKTYLTDEQFFLFGFFALALYPLFFLLEGTLQSHYSHWEWSASLLSFLWILKAWWPQNIRPYFPLYFYASLIYIFPFLSFSLLLDNAFSSLWATHFLLSIFALFLILDWDGALMIILLGTVLAVLFTPPGQHTLASGQHWIIGANYIFAVVMGALFSHNREKVQKEKMQGVLSAGLSVAHELRTPLMAIRTQASGGQRYWKTLLKAYATGKEKGLFSEEIPADRLSLLEKSLSSIEEEAQNANIVIDMLLVNAQPQENHVAQFQVHSIHSVLAEALRRYPFHSEEERCKVFIDLSSDFYFKGSMLLVVHVFFNLLKNALYFIAKAYRGTINISFTKGEFFNEVRFKDTAEGISEENLMRLFERFFSTTPNGTGIGLSFCRQTMENMGGYIRCASESGRYAEFILGFPAVFPDTDTR